MVQKGRSNIVEGHLKGALAIMSNSSEEPLDPTATFLERAFRFYDVIAALSNGTAPLSAAPAAGCLAPLSPLGAPTRSPLSSVDTLLGMATTLWPILHRLSTLPSLKAELDAAVSANASSAKIAVLRTEFEMSASSIEEALQAWQPYVPAGCVATTEVPNDDVPGLELATAPEDTDPANATRRVVELNNDGEDRSTLNPDQAAAGPIPEPAVTGPTAELPAPPPPATHNRLQSILHNALAYKHSALVYLYRTVHELDRSHPAVQRHARASLRHCAGTVSAGGPMGALLWPLFVAACEAVGEGDRALAGEAFLGVERRQGMMNIERAWEIVREVWRRADEGEGGGGETPAAAGPVDEGERAYSPLGEFPIFDFGELFGGGMGMGLGQMGGVGAGAGKRTGRGKGADLWRRVSEDMGVNIVFG